MSWTVEMAPSRGARSLRAQAVILRRSELREPIILTAERLDNHEMTQRRANVNVSVNPRIRVGEANDD